MSDQNFSFDAIVVGSGLGGLSTAGLLSKINKKRVLVLEKHYEIGGLTHEFKRGAYSWDVGLHYLGNLEKRFLDNMGLQMFSFLTDGNLKWNKMPEIFEKLIFPDFTIDVKSSVKAYKKSLFELFPKDKKSINRYIIDVYLSRIWYLLYFFSRFFKSPVKQIFIFLSLFLKKKALMTTAGYLNKYIKNEKLRAVLAARWGNYGAPVTDSAFAIHALVEHHYYNGGIFPDGGAEKISIHIEQTIEKFGGRIFTNFEVLEILIKDNKAYGVKARNLSSANKDVVEFYAPIIVSATGAQSTYLKLLPDMGLNIQKELKNFYVGYSGINVYLGLRESPEKLGIKGENYWITEGYDLDIFNNKSNDLVKGQACYCFLSFPSMKSGKPGGHTADIVSIIPYSLFEEWKKEYWKERDNQYYDIKDKICDGLLNLIEKYIPGFKELIVYKEVATPLTFKHFTGKEDGIFYGLPAIPARYKIKDLQVKTPVKNLYLTGTDVISNGILPALFSGMATVSFINGFFGIIKVMSKVFAYKPKKQKKHGIVDKIYHKYFDKEYGVLVKKRNVSSNLIELTFKFDKNLIFIPGQHIKINVAFSEWRAYSVAKVENSEITIVIDIRPAGHGSKFAQNVNIGDRSIFRMPITDLTYRKTDRDIAFIATGTGIVPFLHIIDEINKDKIKKNIKIFFGCMVESDNFIDQYINPYKDSLNIENIICVEKPISKIECGKGLYTGRVTDMIKEKISDYKKYDFYICGHPNMTESAVKLLRTMGADKIYY